MRRLIYNYLTDKVRVDYTEDELSPHEEDVTGVDELDPEAE